MRRVLIILGILAASAVAGLAVWLATDSTTASYIVGVVGAGVSIAALVIAVSDKGPGPALRARLRLDRVLSSRVVGIDRGPGDGDASADIRTGDIEKSEIIGVRSQSKK